MKMRINGRITNSCVRGHIAVRASDALDVSSTDIGSESNGGSNKLEDHF